MSEPKTSTQAETTTTANPSADETTTTTTTAAESPEVPAVPRIKILADSFIEKYPSTRSCFVLGATGETGKRIVRDLINSGAFSLIKVIARSHVAQEFFPESPPGVKIVINPKLNNYLYPLPFTLYSLGTSHHYRF